MKTIKINLKELLEIASLTKGTEFENKIYLVGGAVRDLLLGHPVKDIDLVIELPNGGVRFSEWMTSTYPDKCRHHVIYETYGTAKFSLTIGLESFEIECVAPRCEEYERTSRNPVCREANLMMNWEKERIERKDIMDFCWVAVDEGSIPLKEWLEIFGYKQEDCGLTAIDHMTDCYHLYLSHGDKFKGVIVEDSNQLRLTAVPKGYTPDAVVYYNWIEYSKHCREFREYQEWLECRNTQRYVDVENHNQKIDGKNLMHCRRLLDMAMEIAETGTLTVKRPNAEYLLQIRKGKVSLEEVIDQAEADLKKLDDLFKNCSLPNEIDKDFVNDLLLELRTM